MTKNYAFPDYLGQSVGLDASRYRCGPLAYVMALAIQERYNEIGKAAEIFEVREDGRHYPGVKTVDEVVSVDGHHDANDIGSPFYVLGKDKIIDYYIRPEITREDFRQEKLKAHRYIDRAINYAMEDLSEENSENAGKTIESLLLNAKQSGYSTKLVFHETEKEHESSILESGFDLNRLGARASDVLPNGAYLKNNRQSIEVAMNPVQMPFLMKADRQEKHFKDRDDIFDFLKEDNVYREHFNESEDIDKKYEKLVDDKRRVLDEMALSDGPGLRGKEARAVRNEISGILEEWRGVQKTEAAKARDRATAIFEKEGVDVVVLSNDSGGWGRSTSTLIILKPEILLSVKQLDGRSLEPSVPYDHEAGPKFGIG